MIFVLSIQLTRGDNSYFKVVGVYKSYRVAQSEIEELKRKDGWCPEWVWEEWGPNDRDFVIEEFDIQ